MQQKIKRKKNKSSLTAHFSSFTSRNSFKGAVVAAINLQMIIMSSTNSLTFFQSIVGNITGSLKLFKTTVNFLYELKRKSIFLQVIVNKHFIDLNHKKKKKKNTGKCTQVSIHFMFFFHMYITVQQNCTAAPFKRWFLNEQTRQSSWKSKSRDYTNGCLPSNMNTFDSACTLASEDVKWLNFSHQTQSCISSPFQLSSYVQIQVQKNLGEVNQEGFQMNNQSKQII